MNSSSVIAFIAAALALAACGHQTGTAATGAGSSAPNAVEGAYHGNAGGGANSLTPASADRAAPPKLP